MNSPPRPRRPVVKILLISATICLLTSCGERSSTQPRSELSNADGISAPVLPAAEAQFIDIVSTAQHKSSQAENDMQRGGIKATRDDGVCRVLASNSFKAEDWVGTVAKIDSNSDGKGVMAISLSHGVTVATWNNEFSDISDNTLIQPRTDLFRTASLLKVGQAVAFTGRFIPDNENCIEESSMTLSGKLDDPDFIFRFSSVARYTYGDRAFFKQGTAASAPVPESSGNTFGQHDDAGNAEKKPERLGGETVVEGSDGLGSEVGTKSREDIWKALQNWKSSILLRDVGRYRESYAGRLTRFYGHADVPIAEVVQMMVDEIKEYPTRELTLSNPSFQRVNEGVQVEYDKAFRFSGPGVKLNQGEVKATQRLRQTDAGTWIITAEFDREICWSTRMRDPLMQSPPGTCR